MLVAAMFRRISSVSASFPFNNKYLVDSGVNLHKKKAGGNSTKFYAGMLRPEVQHFALLHTIFDRKSIPFAYLSLTNDSFTYFV